MLPPEDLRRLITEAMPGATVDIEDLTGTRDHYSITVEAEAFRGKGLLAQQRMIYAALGDAMKGPIHALAIATKVPEKASEA